MTKIGTVGLATEDGIVHVDVFEPDTFDFEPFRIGVVNGVGVFNLVDPSEADTAFRVATDANGIMGVNSVGLTNFTDWSGVEITLPDGNGEFRSDSDTPNKGFASYAARSGDLGYWSEGEARVWSLPGFGLNHYPSAGETFEYWFYPQQWPDPTQYWFVFGAQGNYWQMPGYQVQWISDGTFRVQLNTSSGKSTLTSTSGVSWPQDQWLRGVVDWNSGGGFSTWVETESGTNITSTLSSSDSTYTGGGFAMRGSGNSAYYADDLRVVP